MTNREKFAEKILDIACSGSKIAVNKTTLEPIACNKIMCTDCLFNDGLVSTSCRGSVEKWANSEYVEPPIDWSKVAVDTPILVRDNVGCDWTKRYFAKYENGQVYAWGDGATSWSSQENPVAWTLAKLPERSEHETD